MASRVCVSARCVSAHPPIPTTAPSAALRRLPSLRLRASRRAALEEASPGVIDDGGVGRGSDAEGLRLQRRSLLAAASVTAALSSLGCHQASASGVQMVSDDPGFGQKEATANDLLLVHYVGKVKDSGEVFDSTRGGLVYRDGGPGVNRPAIVRLGGGPVPGICEGLKEGLLGTRVGSVRTFEVPAELGFGSQSVAGPYAVVPGGSTLLYEVEVLRLSSDGPDALVRGISKCGQGGAGAQESGCADIVARE